MGDRPNRSGRVVLMPSKTFCVTDGLKLARLLMLHQIPNKRSAGPSARMQQNGFGSRTLLSQSATKARERRFDAHGSLIV
ncbi:MAG: hypothetical protein LC721_03880 [Actinobacteria bacterium]|nr:hypothetical protein [Actinomycetota bacterium]